MTSSDPKFVVNHSKLKRKHRDEEGDPYQKKAKPNGTWGNLDLILSLERKDGNKTRNVEIQRENIDLAFGFVASGIDPGDRWPKNPVPTSRLLSFMGNWIQHLMISSDENSLNYRCWVVLEFCLKNSSFVVSPNLLQAFTRALKKNDNGGSCLEFFKTVSECLNLILLANARAFSNTHIEFWMSCAVEVDGILSKILAATDGSGFSGDDGLESLLGLLLEHFASFLRFHPNPRNVFRVFVDRLLEPLLDLLVLLHERSNDYNRGQVGDFLGRVEDILSNGLFHPAHINGFFSLRCSSLKKESTSKSIKDSYHRHLFEKLGKFILEKKGKALEGYGYLIRLFVSGARAHKGASSALQGERASAKGNVGSEEGQETNKPLFEVFVQFMQPLLLDGYVEDMFDNLRKGSEDSSKSSPDDAKKGMIDELGKVSEDGLKAAHCMLKSVNEIFSIFIQEKIYVRTQDTSEGKHFTFLKEAYEAAVSISGKTYMLWLSTHSMEDDRVRRMLPLIAKEVIAAMTNFLEIEYKIVEDDLVKLFLMMFSYMAIYMSLEETEPYSLLKSEILSLGCKLINIYSELRQVNNPLFAMCKALRLLRNAGDADAVGYSIFLSSPALSSQIYLRSVGSWLSSQELQLAISIAVQSIPEGQASGCIQEMKTDIIDSLAWIRLPSLSSDDKSLNGTENPFVSFVVLDMQAELLGKLVAEIYTSLLNSLTVTAMNSISVEKSVKDLLTTIGLNFSDLVGNQSGSLGKFIFSVTGRRLNNHDTPESDSLTNTSCIPWVFVFFFRIYVSCRSLYRQTIGLMPPKLSRKASESMGSLFVVASEVDWKEKAESLDEGYFSWVVKPCISLPNLIKVLAQDFISTSSVDCSPLVYVIHVMVLQRLNDLNRLIGAFGFLQGRGKQKSSKRWKRLTAFFKQEAAELTNFITGHLKLSDYEGHFISSENVETSEANPVYDGAWDLGVCSLSEKSLHIAIWRLLCQNVDIWCAHTTDKQLKNFVSCMFLFSIPRGSASRDVNEQRKEEPFCRNITLHHISLEFLTNTVSYEQTVLLKHFTSRFCRVLKKLLAPILSHACASDFDLGSLPDWSEFMKILERGPGVDDMCSPDRSLLSQGVVLPNKQYLENNGRWTNSFSLELVTCESLFNILCRMPKVHVNSKTFSVYAIHVLNFERLVVSNLLNNNGESFIYNPYELLRLFISCRRTMKFLVRASFEESFGAIDSSVCIVFDCSSSILWLLKSVSLIAGLPHIFFGERYSNLVHDLILSLVDHTSSIFWSLSEGRMNVIKAFLIKDGNIQTPPPVDDDPTKKYTSLEADRHSDSSEHLRSEQYLELMAETLENEIKTLLVSLKADLEDTTFESHIRVLSCRKLSSMVSCFQGLLWGLISALDSVYRDCPTENSPCSQLMTWYPSKLRKSIAVFEDLLNMCLHILSIDDNKGAVAYNTSQNPEELHNLNVLPSLDLLAYGAEKNSCCKFEHSSEEDIGSGKQDSGQALSSCSHDINIKSSSGHIHTKASRHRKQKPSSLHADYVGNVINALHKVDLTKLKNLEGSLLQNLLKDEAPQCTFGIRQLLNSSAAILKLKSMLSSPMSLGSKIHYSQLSSSSVVILLQTSQLILRKMAEMVGKPDQFSFLLLDGVLTFLEVVGSMFSFMDPNLSKDAYAQLIDTHLRAIGRCISLQGKAATLSSHETGSNTKLLHYQEQTSINGMQLIGHGHFNVNAFKARLRMSFKNLIRRPSKLHLKTALQSIERVLVGIQQGCNVFYEIGTGNLDGGEVPSIVAAGVDCLDLVLESASGFPAKHKLMVQKKVFSLVGALFNIVLHIQNPKIFHAEKLLNYASEAKPDAGAVILMCVEVLTRLASNHSFPMDPCQVSQCLHIPLALFEYFRQVRDSHLPYASSKLADERKSVRSKNMHHNIDRQFSVELYASCCRLLCSTLNHRKSEAERCIAMLEDSVTTLLNCLEMADAGIFRGNCYHGWKIEDVIKCASFFRRIYEEIRQQKDVFGKYSTCFLSNYIGTYSGYGPLKVGIKREIDEALRPGVYSLIDMCTEADCQLLHTLLGEGPCRSTLKSLLQDYKLNFQYDGKI